MALPLQQSQKIPVNIVGGTNFGRYPKINEEQTWNMIVSDGFLINYSGYKKSKEIVETGQGRSIFTSSRSNKMIFVVNNLVFLIDNNLNAEKIGNLNTFVGDVFIDENNAQQIAISDLLNIWIYDYSVTPTHPLPTFTKAPLEDDFLPGPVTFHDGYFITPMQGKPLWRLSAPNNGMSWPFASNTVGGFQTKPDNVVAIVRIPSKGNLIFVMGRTVTEAWVDVGSSLFPYQRSSQYNIDYGCINPATIAQSNEFIVWLGINEKSGIAILVSNGGPPKQLSNEGWNFRFSQLKHPEQSYGFLFLQDGHLIYQLTFYNEEDDFSLIYDFTTSTFFNVSDENLNAHIATDIAFFNSKYYFASAINGHLYELNTTYYDLDGKNMPMIRITPNFRMPNQAYFVPNNLTFVIEQGTNLNNVVPIPAVTQSTNYVTANEGEDYVTANDSFVVANNYNSNDNLNNMMDFEVNHLPTTPRVDLSISKDGGETFGSATSKWMRPIGYRRNKMNYWKLGISNEITFQLRFHGNQRFIVGNGEMEIYQ